LKIRMMNNLRKLFGNCGRSVKGVLFLQGGSVSYDLKEVLKERVGRRGNSPTSERSSRFKLNLGNNADK